jgi:hypothetical protein
MVTRGALQWRVFGLSTTLESQFSQGKRLFAPTDWQDGPTVARVSRYKA